MNTLGDDIHRGFQSFLADLREEDQRNAERAERRASESRSLPFVTKHDTTTGPSRFLRNQREEEVRPAGDLPASDTTPVLRCYWYPWPGRNDGDSPLIYPYDDLPDAIQVTIRNHPNIPDGTYSAGKSPYFSTGWIQYTFGGDDTSETGNGFALLNTFYGQQTTWVGLTYGALYSSSSSSVVGASDQEDGRYLLFNRYSHDGGDNVGDDVDAIVFTVKDTFPDTLTVNGVDTITRPAGSGSCQWSGPRSAGGSWKLDYNQTTPYKFTLSGGTRDVKTPYQNDPRGTYGTQVVT